MYIQQRWIHESHLEKKVLKELREGYLNNIEYSILMATEKLNAFYLPMDLLYIRTKLFSLAEGLYQSIHMQLDVDLYKAIGLERGANLASIDTPLNDRIWITKQLDDTLQLTNVTQQILNIRELL